MKNKAKSFTMVELIVTIVVILILSSFVVANVMGAQEKAANDKMISNANVLANALNQYALENGRKFPQPYMYGTLDEDKYYGVRASWLVGNQFAQRYIGNETDVLTTDLQYIVRGDLKRAAVVSAPKKVAGESSTCNLSSSGSHPDIITKYLAGSVVRTTDNPGTEEGFKFYNGTEEELACYFISL